MARHDTCKTGACRAGVVTVIEARQQLGMDPLPAPAAHTAALTPAQQAEVNALVESRLQAFVRQLRATGVI